MSVEVAALNASLSAFVLPLCLGIHMKKISIHFSLALQTFFRISLDTSDEFVVFWMLLILLCESHNNKLLFKI